MPTRPTKSTSGACSAGKCEGGCGAIAPILAELSGGLDSSYIVCTADDILAKEGSQTPRLDTISFYDNTEPHGDDRRFFRLLRRSRRESDIKSTLSILEMVASRHEHPDFSRHIFSRVHASERVNSRRICHSHSNGPLSIPSNRSSAPETTAPVESATLPDTVAVSICAAAVKVIHKWNRE
jgi:Asparagine synthase